MTVIFENISGFKIAWCTDCGCMLHDSSPERAERRHLDWHERFGK